MATILSRFAISAKASPKDRDKLRESSVLLNQRALQSRASTGMRAAARRLIKSQIKEVLDMVALGGTAISDTTKLQWTQQNADLWTPYLLSFIEQGQRFAGAMLGGKSGPVIKAKRVESRIITSDPADGIPFGQPDIKAFILESATGSTRYMSDLLDRHITIEANKLQDIHTTDQLGAPVIVQASKTPAQIASSLSRLKVVKNMPVWRSKMLARTFTIWGYNKGAVDTYRAAGVQQYEWLTAKDDLTCPYCRALDGKIVRMGGSFFEPGQTPQGVDGNGKIIFLSPLPFTLRHPPLHPHCRCSVIPVIN